MNAIAGLVRRDGALGSSVDAQRMLERLAYRGLTMSSWSVGSCALSWRASQAPSQMTAEKPGLRLVGDVRVDNRTELERVLGVERSDDALLVLEAYAKWGDDAPQNLIGDFAFVIWDAGRRSLLCARDHSGVKPLYYHVSRDLFAFASEIDGLLALPAVPRRLNEATLAEFLTVNFEDERSTLYAGIVRLPPAHSLSVGPGTASLRRYWQFEPTRELRLRSDADYAECFRDLFTQAVSDRLVGPGLVGATLSGGLDSSSVALTAQRLVTPRRLHTFSAAYDETPESDEREFSRSAALYSDVNNHEVHPERFSPLQDWDNAVWKASEPHFNPQISLTWAVLEDARDRDIGVILEGQGGDWVVSHGLPRLVELARAGRLPSLLTESAALARRGGGRTAAIAFRQGFRPLAPALLTQAARVWRRRRAVWLRNVPLVASFAERPDIAEGLAILEAEQLKTARSAREDHWGQLTAGGVSYSLGIIDRAYALYDLEPRHPFLDIRLAEFCLALPAEQKLRNGWTRWILRNAMGGVLPEKVRWRPAKANLGYSFSRKLQTADREVVEETLFRSPGALAEYVDLEAVRNEYRRLQRSAPPEPETFAPSFMIWRVAVLARWLEFNKLP